MRVAPGQSVPVDKETQNDEDSDLKTSVFGTRTRFVMVVIVLICLASIWSNILAFNFAVICMETPQNVSNGDESLDTSDRHDFTNSKTL
ncbi:unnamed protein product [Gongylonema pulchrum]|uniref:G_PROTEIN_RECEP_F1_2 domain-containing protein n=1 Tax=Gongylonema pulchrum TaxID=637853 RepID=A0A183E7B9_9BILA|nr:unnamed protein product [Gongylonema pulchrum]